MEHLTSLLTTTGYIGFFAILFLETSLPVCFFLPGDTLLLAAGMLAADGAISFPILLIVGISAAIAGGYLGFGLGKYMGNRLFAEHKKGLFDPKHKRRAEAFYEKYGTLAVLLARFVPVVRTFISTIAGIGRMSYKKFSIANSIGGIIWVGVVTSIGFFLGHRFPKLLDFIPIVFGLVVALSLLPILYSFFSRWLKKQKRN